MKMVMMADSKSLGQSFTADFTSSRRRADISFEYTSQVDLEDGQRKYPWLSTRLTTPSCLTLKRTFKYTY